jgi:hypothetical protein
VGVVGKAKLRKVEWSTSYRHDGRITEAACRDYEEARLVAAMLLASGCDKENITIEKRVYPDYPEIPKGRCSGWFQTECQTTTIDLADAIAIAADA